MTPEQLRTPQETLPVGQPSPLWRGCRISVIIPTYNRKDQLLKCLRALEAQSILPQEFEVIVIDDGSTDGTEVVVRSEESPFVLQYLRQDHLGPGVARNLGIQQATGELVLFTGDDIIADERLLENHLLAHAQFPAETTAVLGYITWPPWMRPNQVMKYIYGDSGRQFGYPRIERAPSLDYRFFYTSNISLKRKFLISAAAGRVSFDPAYRYAAWEDIDFGYRLQARGLEVKYWKDAIGYHDHWVDVDSFSRREYLAGQMAIVFYRKHPGVASLEIRSLNDWNEIVEEISRQPALFDGVKTLENNLESWLHSLAASLEERLESSPSPGNGLSPSGRQSTDFKTMLDNVLTAIFTMHATRGHVQEWYANVGDQSKTEAAKIILSLFKGMDSLSYRARAAAADREQALLERVSVQQQAIAALEAQVTEKDRELNEIYRGRGWRLIRAFRWMRSHIPFMQTLAF